MKKITLILLLLVGIGQMSADYNAGYYKALDGKKKEALKAAVKQTVSNHTRLGYYDLPDYWRYSDVYPEKVNGSLRWWDMYSDETYLIYGYESGVQSFKRNSMQREHSIPKSWWKYNGDIEYTPAYSDMWNLYPSDAAANQAKSNYPFAPVTSASKFDNGISKVGPPQRGYGGGANLAFEPADEYKGDFARAFFYMATVYDDIHWTYHYMFNQQTYPTLTPWAVEMLLQWARTDRVSQKEIDRNNAVEQFQGNRNPYIDFPELAEYVWGLRTAETFYIADQSKPDPTPPITGEPEITAPINGEQLGFGQTAKGHAVTRVLQISGHNLTEALSLRVTGTDKALFVPAATSIPPSTMNSNGGYLLEITYLPTTVGKHTAKLILYDGGMEGSIAVELNGEALETPSFTALTALPATDVTADSYVANWQPAVGIADYYIVKRTKLYPGNEETEVYETGETHYVMTGREAAVPECYTVSYARLGLTGGESNSVYVSADSGIGSNLAATPLRVLSCEGGVVVLRAEGEAGEVTIYNVAGMRLVHDADPSDGTIYPLAQGIYLVSIAGLPPVKLIVAN